MFRQLARLAEEHELLEALPFLRGNADDEDDLIQDAIAALPPLVARFFFAPRGGPKAPPLLGRCFTLKKLSAPHDVREACLRGAANSFRFRAEYRWSACAVGFVAGFADGSAWSASWLVARLKFARWRRVNSKLTGCAWPRRARWRAAAGRSLPDRGPKARRAAARKAARRRRLAGRRVCVKNVGADQCRNQKNASTPSRRHSSRISISKQAPARSELADGALRLRDDRGNKHAFDSGRDFVLSPRDAVAGALRHRRARARGVPRAAGGAARAALGGPGVHWPRRRATGAAGLP